MMTGVTGVMGLTEVTRDAWMTMASKVGERGGEEGGGEGKDVTIAGPTNKRIKKQGKIELLSQLTMEG